MFKIITKTGTAFAASSGNDTIITLGHDIVVFGLDGNDTLFGIGHHLTLNGDGGNDSLFAAGNHNTLNGGNGADSLTALGDSSTLSGGVGNDVLTANGDHAVLMGGYDSDIYNFNGVGSNALCEIDGTSAASFLRANPGQFNGMINYAAGVYEYFGITADLTNNLAVERGMSTEVFNGLVVGQNQLDIHEFVPWLFVVAESGLLGPVTNYTPSGGIDSGDYVLHLIGKFLDNTQSFGEAKATDALPDSVESFLTANGVGDNDAVFKGFNIAAEEVFAFTGHTAADVQENILQIFNFGTSYFGAYGIAESHVQAVGIAHGVAHIDTTGLIFV